MFLFSLTHITDRPRQGTLFVFLSSCDSLCLTAVSLCSCCTFYTGCSLPDLGWRLPLRYLDGWRRKYNGSLKQFSITCSKNVRFRFLLSLIHTKISCIIHTVVTLVLITSVITVIIAMIILWSINSCWTPFFSMLKKQINYRLAWVPSRIQFLFL